MSTHTRYTVDRLARRAGVPADQINAVFQTIATVLEEGGSVTVKGFGSFAPRFTKPRTITSPALPDGEAKVKRRRTIRFRISDTLKDRWVLED